MAFKKPGDFYEKMFPRVFININKIHRVSYTIFKTPYEIK